MVAAENAKSPLDRVLKQGLNKLEEFGIPEDVTGLVRERLETVQQRVAANAEDLQHFSVAGVTRTNTTVDFLLDKLEGRPFRAMFKENNSATAVPLECKIVHEGKEGKIYGVDEFGNKHVLGSIKIEGIQRFKARATGIRIDLNKRAMNVATLSNLNKLFKNDRYFGRLRSITFDLNDALKFEAGKLIAETYLDIAPTRRSALPSREVGMQGARRMQYYAEPPLDFDMFRQDVIESAAAKIPEVAVMYGKLKKFAEKHGYTGPAVTGTATTNGWWIKNLVGQVRKLEDWGYDPCYQEARCAVNGIELRK